jgi:large subunit ribosomal protein L35
MPKLKTNRGAAKRFRTTKSGGLKRTKSGFRHLKTAKSAKRLRNSHHPGMVDSSELKRIKMLLPYS